MDTMIRPSNGKGAGTGQSDRGNPQKSVGSDTPRSATGFHPANPNEVSSHARGFGLQAPGASFKERASRKFKRAIFTDHRFPELSYASDKDPKLKQWLIRRIEKLSGRDHFADLYEIWKKDIVGKSETMMGDMLTLINVDLKVEGVQWPPESLPETPLVMVANHPFGIGDGIAILSLAEKLGRPFKVIINNELLKVPEIRPYSLPISFEESREAMAMNLETRKEAVKLLKEGVTIVVFPAGGVATAKRGLGRASDLPWKLFPAKMIQSANASVVPVYFEGQNGRLFHLASSLSVSARTSLFIREFRRLVGRSITARVGEVIHANHLAGIRDRKEMTDHLFEAVFSMASKDGTLVA